MSSSIFKKIGIDRCSEFETVDCEDLDEFLNIYPDKRINLNLDRLLKHIRQFNTLIIQKKFDAVEDLTDVLKNDINENYPWMKYGQICKSIDDHINQVRDLIKEKRNNVAKSIEAHNANVVTQFVPIDDRKMKIQSDIMSIVGISILVIVGFIFGIIDINSIIYYFPRVFTIGTLIVTLLFSLPPVRRFIQRIRT